MKKKKVTSLLGFIVCILALSLFISGGCDIDFSSGDDNNNGNGGNGNREAILQGTIIPPIVPDTDIEGITVQVEDEDTGVFFPDITDSTGSFRIEGDFSGLSSDLEFLDQDLTQIAVTNVTVFPRAEIDLGDITINNGIVTFEDDITVDFEGDITDNNCSDGLGTIEVEVDDTDVIVEVSSSTDIMRDGDDLDCEDLLIGNEIRILGELLTGTSVAADLIELN